MPLVSVIIPAYNAEKTIHETIESVLNQTFTDFELIIVNDGSTDNTLEVISQIDDSRLKVFSYPNAGVSASRNRGVSHAVGKYISFIDADDLWTSNKLKAQLEAIQKEPQAAVAYSWTDFIDQEGKFIDRDERVTYSGDVYPQMLVRDFLSSASNVMIRRRAFIESGRFDESLAGAADWDLFLRLAARYHFVMVPQVGIFYRIADRNSMSSDLQKQEEDCLKVIERAFTQAPESLQHLKQKSLASLYEYLSFKAIEGSFTRDNGLLATRYYWRALKCDRSILKWHIGVNLRVYLKIIATLILPSKFTETLVSEWRAYAQKFSEHQQSKSKIISQ